jgi:hypothetical protein
LTGGAPPVRIRKTRTLIFLEVIAKTRMRFPLPAARLGGSVRGQQERAGAHGWVPQPDQL